MDFWHASLSRWKVCVIFHVLGIDMYFFLTFRDHLHIFVVGQSSPSFSGTVCFQPCQLLFNRFSYIFPGVVEPSPSRLPSSIFPTYNHIHHFSCVVVCFSSPDLSIPYIFCLRIADIWHKGTLASSCITWFLTWCFHDYYL